MKLAKFVFPRKGHVGHVAPCARFSPDALAEVVGDHVMVARLLLAFRGNRPALVVNAVEDLDEFEYTHLDAGFFQQLPRHAFFERLPKLQRASGNRPLPAQRFAAAPDQQRAAIFNDYATNTDDGPFWVFPGRCHSIQAEQC